MNIKNLGEKIALKIQLRVSLHTLFFFRQGEGASISVQIRERGFKKTMSQLDSCPSFQWEHSNWCQILLRKGLKLQDFDKIAIVIDGEKRSESIRKS